MNQFNLATLATSAGVLGLVKALQGLYAGLRNVAQQSIQNYAHFESMQKGLETFFQSADKGKSKFEELRKLSNTTTFGVDELANSFTQLANVGVEVDSINDKLMMLGNISQGDKTKFAELVSIYAKIQSTGKAGSMQIQQLAARGIPIYDMLKKIGVQGTATGKDITKAFQEMTKEGGQFYNAMNNINDTIEGKQGFIQDYFKELMVNFAEVTGLAEIYKSVLDTVKEAIGAVSDKLLEWNQDPISKALFSGALVATLGTITSILTGGIVVGLVAVGKQLQKRIAELTAINILTGNIGNILLAGTIVGLGAGLAVGLTKYVKEANEATKELKQAIEDAKGTGGSGYNGANGFTGHYYSNDEEYKHVQEMIKYYRDELEKRRNSLGMLSAIFDNPDQQQYMSQDQKDTLQANIDTLKEEIVTYRELMKTYNKRKQELEEMAEQERKVKEATESLVQGKSILEDFIKDSEWSKKMTELDEYEKKIKEINDLLYKKDPINQDKYFYGDLIEGGETAIRELENKIRKLNGLAEIKTWREYWKAVTGAQIGDKEIIDMNGETISNKTIGDLRNQIAVKSSAAYAMGGDRGTVANVYQTAKEQVDGYINALLSLVDKNGNAVYSAEDDSITNLIAFSKELENTTKELQDLDVKEKFGKIIGNAFYDAAGNVGGDVGTFVQSLKTTGQPLIALINTIVGALFNALASVDGFEETLSPITELFKKFTPLFRVLIGIVQDVEDIMDDALTPIVGLINMLAVPLKAISLALTPITRFLLTIGGLLTWLSDVMDKFGIVTKEATKAQEVDLTSAYKSLLEAMKANEEEYERRKKQLNASDYASKVTGVHDMILTPQGQFSTDPDDYIIATKNPSQLSSVESNSGVTFAPNIVIQNYNDSEVKTSSDGMGNIFVKISQKIASDYAEGNNGWDNAVLARAVRNNGRNLVL